MDLRPLRNVLFEARTKYKDSDVVAQVERILGTAVGGQGGIEMKGPDGTNYRVLSHHNFEAQKDPSKDGRYFMLVQEDKNGMGTQIVRDEPKLAANVDAVRPFVEKAQQAMDALRAKISRGEVVTAADLRPLRIALFEAREKSPSAVVPVEKILGTIEGQGGVEIKGTDGTYLLKAEDGFYFTLTKKGQFMPTVTDYPGIFGKEDKQR